VAGSCEYGDERLGSGATELVTSLFRVLYLTIIMGCYEGPYQPIIIALYMGLYLAILLGCYRGPYHALVWRPRIGNYNGLL
jgi:hypothetical protein